MPALPIGGGKGIFTSGGRSGPFTRQSVTLFSILLAGTNPHCIEARTVAIEGGEPQDNPLFRFVQNRYLPFLDREAVGDLLSIGRYMGLRFPAETADAIYRDFGGHPFLTREACSYLHQRLEEEGITRPVTVTPELYEDLKDFLDLHDVVEQILGTISSRYKEEFRLLGQIARGEGGTIRDLLAIKHLRGYGLVRPAEGSLLVTIGAVREHLLLSSPEPDTAEPAASPPVLLEGNLFYGEFTAFENFLRQILRQGLEAFHPDAKGAVYRAIRHPKKDPDWMNLNLEALLRETMFGDVIDLIKGNWNYLQQYHGPGRFGEVEHKQQVEIWLRFIQQVRNPAYHSNPPLPGEFQAAVERMRELRRRNR